MALIHIAEDGYEGRLRRAILDEALRIRDMLKFEFFFSASDEFEQEIRDELSDHDPQLEQHLQEGDVASILATFQPLMSDAILRAFFDAYRVVGDLIEENAYRAGLDAESLRPVALDRGREYLDQGLLTKPASVSKVLFESALGLADNRGLFIDRATTIAERQAFAEELRDAVHHLDALVRWSADH
jgi:glycerol-3-phosphate O-acyltransferase